MSCLDYADVLPVEYFCKLPKDIEKRDLEPTNFRSFLFDWLDKTNSVLFNQIQTLKKLINEKGCKPDSVYKFSEKELIPENVKKGIYVVNVPVPSDGIRVPKYVRLLKVYYPNGTLFREIQFSQGLRNGFDKRYFVTGKKYIDLHYKNGLKDGVQTQYYVSGKKDFEVEFKNGKHVGIMKEYSREKGSITTKKNDEYTGFGW